MSENNAQQIIEIVRQPGGYLDSLLCLLRLACTSLPQTLGNRILRETKRRRIPRHTRDQAVLHIAHRYSFPIFAPTQREAIPAFRVHSSPLLSPSSLEPGST